MQRTKIRTTGLITNCKKNRPKTNITGTNISNISSNQNSSQNKCIKQNSLRQMIYKFNTQKCSPKKTSPKSQIKIALLKEKKNIVVNVNNNNYKNNNINEHNYNTYNLQYVNVNIDKIENTVGNIKNLYVKSTKESPKVTHHIQFNQKVNNNINNNGFFNLNNVNSNMSSNMNSNYNSNNNTSENINININTNFSKEKVIIINPQLLKNNNINNNNGNIYPQNSIKIKQINSNNNINNIMNNNNFAGGNIIANINCTKAKIRTKIKKPSNKTNYIKTINHRNKNILSFTNTNSINSSTNNNNFNNNNISYTNNNSLNLPLFNIKYMYPNQRKKQILIQPNKSLKQQRTIFVKNITKENSSINVGNYNINMTTPVTVNNSRKNSTEKKIANKNSTMCYIQNKKNSILTNLNSNNNNNINCNCHNKNTSKCIYHRIQPNIRDLSANYNNEKISYSNYMNYNNISVNNTNTQSYNTNNNTTNNINTNGNITNVNNNNDTFNNSVSHKENNIINNNKSNISFNGIISNNNNLLLASNFNNNNSNIIGENTNYNSNNHTHSNIINKNKIIATSKTNYTTSNSPNRHNPINSIHIKLHGKNNPYKVYIKTDKNKNMKLPHLTVTNSKEPNNRHNGKIISNNNKNSNNSSYIKNNIIINTNFSSSKNNKSIGNNYTTSLKNKIINRNNNPLSKTISNKTSFNNLKSDISNSLINTNNSNFNNSNINNNNNNLFNDFIIIQNPNNINNYINNNCNDLSNKSKSKSKSKTNSKSMSRSKNISTSQIGGDKGGIKKNPKILDIKRCLVTNCMKNRGQNIGDKNIINNSNHKNKLSSDSKNNKNNFYTLNTEKKIKNSGLENKEDDYYSKTNLNPSSGTHNNDLDNIQIINKIENNNLNLNRVNNSKNNNNKLYSIKFGIKKIKKGKRHLEKNKTGDVGFGNKKIHNKNNNKTNLPSQSLSHNSNSNTQNSINHNTNNNIYNNNNNLKNSISHSSNNSIKKTKHINHPRKKNKLILENNFILNNISNQKEFKCYNNNEFINIINNNKNNHKTSVSQSNSRSLSRSHKKNSNNSKNHSGIKNKNKKDFIDASQKESEEEEIFDSYLNPNPSKDKEIKLQLIKQGIFYQKESERLSAFIKKYSSTYNNYPKSQVSFYKYGRLIGKGAFGKVNLGLHILTGKIVAIKSFNKKNIKNERARQKILHEIELMKNLRHSSVVKILDNFETKNYLLIIMENISGGDLLTFVKKRTKLNEKTCKFIFRQLLESLKYIHSKNIIHRDIKLDNILIDLNNNIKLCDFGVGKLIHEGGLLKDQCGTPAYIAPEILGGGGYEGPPVDVWSSGVVLYAMLSGTVPFKANNLSELHSLIMMGSFKEIQDISNESKDLLHKLLEINPKKRITIDEALRHPWLSNNILEENKFSLFTKAEMILLSKNNVDYRNCNKEEMIEKFTLKNLDTKNVIENKNNITKSFIFAPFNSSYQKDELDYSHLEEQLEIENHLILFDDNANILNRQYELNNNGEIDHGVLINKSNTNRTNNNTNTNNNDNKENMNNDSSNNYIKMSPAEKNISKSKEGIDNINAAKNSEDKEINKEKTKDIIEKKIKGANCANRNNGNNVTSLLTTCSTIIIDENVLKVMEGFGYKKDYIQRCFANNEVNYCTATYYLLTGNAEIIN